MSLNICVLASGSSGNATAIWTERSGILIDCGCSRAYTETTLAEIKMRPDLLKGLLITHGHSDHLSSSAVSMCIARRIPLYIHEETYRAVTERRGMEKLRSCDESLVKYHCHNRFALSDFSIEPFSSYHTGGSAGESFGFCVSWQSPERTYRIGYLTDTGKIDEGMISKLLNCNALVLEANHDPALVRASSRHYLNRQWVLSDYGHLCNRDAGRLIARIKRDSTERDVLKYVFIAHISRDHNSVDTALSQVSDELQQQQTEGVRLLPTWHRRKSAVLKIA